VFGMSAENELQQTTGIIWSTSGDSSMNACGLRVVVD